MSDFILKFCGGGCRKLVRCATIMGNFIPQLLDLLLREGCDLVTSVTWASKSCIVCCFVRSYFSL